MRVNYSAIGAADAAYGLSVERFAPVRDRGGGRIGGDFAALIKGAYSPPLNLPFTAYIEVTRRGRAPAHGVARGVWSLGGASEGGGTAASGRVVTIDPMACVEGQGRAE